MRIAFLGLLLANLVAFGWSQWLAPSPASSPPAARPSGPGPARILLANERPAASPAVVTTPDVTDITATTTASATTKVAAATHVVAASVAAAGSAGVAGTAPASLSAAPTAAGLAIAVLATPSAAVARRCASMGPFSDAEGLAQATAMLQQDGYAPRQRAANGAVVDSYMVVIRRLRNEADQARVVARLNRGGLDDAFAIPKLDDGHAVSVGLFSQARRAERRALAVGKMGFKAEIVERTRPDKVYWLDFDLKTPAAGSADPFAAGSADAAQKWQVVACPAPAALG
ncbi:MAG: hypothetical protein IT481_04045 [Gammaproteobacteria bacterium]|nr:hypothetical protein [Gammaproteobacteria bacterium]